MAGGGYAYGWRWVHIWPEVGTHMAGGGYAWPEVGTHMAGGGYALFGACHLATMHTLTLEHVDVSHRHLHANTHA